MNEEETNNFYMSFLYMYFHIFETYQSVCKWPTNPGQYILCTYKFNQWLPLRVEVLNACVCLVLI